MDLTGKTVVVAVGGGVSAYKACDLIRELKRRGAAKVWPILTPGAQAFVSPLTLGSLAMQPATSDALALDVNGVPLHISLAQQADALLIVAATANLLARLAAGMADDLVTTTALTFTGKPVIIAPAMNTRMWHHPITQRNLQTLAQTPDYYIISPSAGHLACGETGDGHLASQESILRNLYRQIHPLNTVKHKPLAGLKALVSAGGTREPLDAVRELTNRSSGRMGLALADELDALGAEVTLVAAGGLQGEIFTNLERPYRVIPAVTVNDLSQTMLTEFKTADWTWMAAAVSDFRLPNPALHKLKKQPGQSQVSFELEISPDILAQLGALKQPHQTLIGFAAETEHWLERGKAKLLAKKLDGLVLNDVSRNDIGFNAPNNEASLLWSDESITLIEKSPKPLVARALIQKVLHQTRLHGSQPWQPAQSTPHAPQDDTPAYLQ